VLFFGLFSVAPPPPPPEGNGVARNFDRERPKMEKWKEAQEAQDGKIVIFETFFGDVITLTALKMTS